jgi:Transmembrane domain of unknown function (DUF3566)
VDKQADPVAPLADEAGDSAPKLDTNLRKSSKAKAEPGKNSASSASANSAGASDQSEQNSQSAETSDSAAAVPAEVKAVPADAKPVPADAKTVQAKTVRAEPKNGSSASGAAKPSFAKSADSNRSDATVPRESVWTVGGGKLGANWSDVTVGPDGAAKATGISDLVDPPAPVRTAKSGSTPNAASAPSPGAAKDDAGDGGDDSTAALAAAALARELTGAGFASPGFTSPNAASASATTSPGWATPTQAAGTPTVAATDWAAPAAGAPTPGAPTAGPPAWASSAPEAPVSSAPASPAAPAPAKTGAAASGRSAYSPSGAMRTGALTDPGGSEQTAAASAEDHFSAPQPGQDSAGSVPSEDFRSKVAVPFGAVGRKKKLRPSAVRKPGGIGNGKASMTVKNKSGTARRPAPQVAPSSTRPEAAEVRDAQLVVARIEPWSVLKFSFLVSLLGWFVLVVAVAVIYFVFSSLGVFHSIEQTIGLVTSSSGNPGSNAASWFSAGTVLGYTMLAGAIDVILFTALATVGAAIYNAVTHLSGGVEITLQEAD